MEWFRKSDGTVNLTGLTDVAVCLRLLSRRIYGKSAYITFLVTKLRGPGEIFLSFILKAVK